MERERSGVPGPAPPSRARDGYERALPAAAPLHASDNRARDVGEPAVKARKRALGMLFLAFIGLFFFTWKPKMM